MLQWLERRGTDLLNRQMLVRIQSGAPLILGANSARTIAQDIVVIVVLLLRWATGGCALEDQLLFHGRVAQRMSADFLHRRMHVRIVSRSPTWRVNWAGAQRRLLSDRPARRRESCSQLSARSMRAWRIGVRAWLPTKRCEFDSHCPHQPTFV